MLYATKFMFYINISFFLLFILHRTPWTSEVTNARFPHELHFLHPTRNGQWNGLDQTDETKLQQASIGSARVGWAPRETKRTDRRVTLLCFPLSSALASLFRSATIGRCNWWAYDDAVHCR